MMNERRRKLQTIKVDHYDGQSIYSNDELIYELGGYLGGGAAGVVYEAFCMRTKQHVAIKILNPVGYKLFPSTLLARCVVAIKGKPLDASRPLDQMPLPRGGSRSGPSTPPMRQENVWWLVHPTTKQAIAAYEDPRTGMLRELTLPQCIDVWGAALQPDSSSSSSTGSGEQRPEDAYHEVEVKNQVLKIPTIPKKFLKFAYTRRSIHREISNMSGLDFHEHVLRLDAALELVQDSKCTTFLVLELAAGGELFDRIKLDCGTDEATARRYFCQLISGVAFCHSSGVCHRDLKPENLLLADTEEHSTLKIADFGLSAIFAFTDSSSSDNSGSDGQAQCIRRLRSVVGSPHYVAPEVLMDAGQGYDGAKADAWSIGVILYAMIAGNLPFGKDLLKCLRYDKFRKWSYQTKYSDDDPADEVTFPSWFFPQHFSLEVKSLIAQLLYPDPCMRLAVEEAQHHAWVLAQLLPKARSPSNDDDNSAALLHTPHAIAASPMAPSSAATPSTPSSYKSRASVVVNVPQSTIDQEHRWSALTSARSGLTSPHSFSRPLGLSICPPSPQMSARAINLVSAGGGYMPSVDEEASPLAGQTPPTSPRACAQQSTSAPSLEQVPTIDLREAESAATSLQFDLEPAHAVDAVEAIDGRLPHSSNSVSDVSSAADDTGDSAAAHQHELNERPSRVASRRRFVSPPLAIESRSSAFHRSHQHRRNSPPELYLARFEKAAKLEAIRPFNLDLLDLSGNDRSSSSASPSALLPSAPLHESSPALAHGQSAASDTLPPTRSDHVARSTQFVTALPAPLVLAKIDAILAANPSPLPYPYKNVPQRVAIDWTKYQLEVRYGSMLSCTVQVFLYQRGVYLVEFRRGQVEIFQFKRFYEAIREKMAEGVESSSAAALMTTPSAATHAWRKRNKSISTDDSL